MERLALGKYQVNCYILRCQQNGSTIIVDPGDEPASILRHVEETRVRYILLTHNHPDHIGGLEQVVQSTKAPVAVHALAQLPQYQ